MEYALARDRGIPPSDDKPLMSLLFQHSLLARERLDKANGN